MATTERDLRAAVGLLVYLATLPLQWQVLVDTPVGILRIFHLGAAALLVLAPPSLKELRSLRDRARPLPGALCLMLLLLFGMALVYRSDWTEPVREAVYALTGLAVAVAFRQALSTARGRRLLVLALPVSLLSWLLFFTATLFSLGIDPATALGLALSGQPDQFFTSVFRPVFATGGGDSRAQVRHEVFAALLVAGYLTWTAATDRVTKLFSAGATLVLIAALALSLSRAVMLAALLVPLLALLAALVKIRVSSAFAVTAAAVVAALVWVGDLVGPTIWARLGDTSSYESRAGAILNLSTDDVLFRLFLGGGNFGTSTHTMILDAGLRGGVMAGAAAAVVVAVIARHTVRAVARYVESSHAADLAAAGAGLLVLVRSFTAGGGLLHLVEWTAFGLLLAVEAHRGSTGDLKSLAPEPNHERLSRAHGRQRPRTSAGRRDRR